ncbi:MAG: tRNA adenosine(34) deaminase TadA [Gammaproteobacteria bacterium]|nr:tRNA adenosine(34) deaminase TadA [Gammaproteobacteria bacterium]
MGIEQDANDKAWMQQAICLAEKAEEMGEVPVGAVIVRDGELVAEGWNQPISMSDPTAHAEIVALRNAAVAEKNYRISGTTLYVTLEPCVMCLGAMVHARVARLVFGASDPKSGVMGSCTHLHQAEWFNHKIEVTANVLESSCADLLKNFFKKKRQKI